MTSNIHDEQKIIALSEALSREGYVVVRKAIAPEVLAELQKELGVYYKDYPNSSGVFYGDKTVRFGSVFAKSPTSHDLATDPVVLGTVEAILKPFCDRIQINLTQAIGIQPHQDYQVPHRDDSMFPFEHENAQFMINCMWALTPFNEDNGGTRVWPKSHLGSFDPNIDLDAAICPDLDAGDVLIYLGSTVHSGGRNQTNAMRKGLVLSYSLGWLRQAENQYLANPPALAATYSPKLQELVGYAAHRPNLGWYEGQDPSTALKNTKGLQPTHDLLPPELEAMAAAYQEAQQLLKAS